MRDGRIVEVMEVVGVEGSRVLFERYLPLHDTVLKRYRVAAGPSTASIPLHFISLCGIQSSTGNPLIMRWVDFVHDEFSRVDSEISAFMTGFDRAVTVDLGAAGGCGEHAGMAAAGRLDD